MRDLFNLEEQKLADQSKNEIKKVSPEEGLLERRMEAAIAASAKKDKLSATYSKYEYVNIL